MNEFAIIFSNFSATFFPLFVNLTWQFALLVGCVWLVIKVGWVRSATTQHSLWLLCVFSPILLVGLGVVMPNTNFLLQQKIGQNFKDAPTSIEGSINDGVAEEGFRNNSSNELTVRSTSKPAAYSTSELTVRSTSDKNGNPSEVQPPLPITTTSLAKSDDKLGYVEESAYSSVRWISYAPMVVGLVWIVGVGFSLLRLGWGVFGLRKLRKNAKPITSGPLLKLLETLKTQMDIRRSVAIAVSQHVHAPISLGVWRPVILLPTDGDKSQVRSSAMNCAEGDEPQVRSSAMNCAKGDESPYYERAEKAKLAFIHELAHIRRYDALINWCQQILGAFCFFYPLFHLASRRLTQAREQICDNWVMQQSGKRGEYASFLAGLLEAATSKGMARSISLAIIPAKYSIVRRINMILEPRNTIKTKLSRKTASIVLLVGLSAILLLSATRILPMPSLFARTATADSQSSGSLSENATIADEEMAASPENSHREKREISRKTRKNLSGAIENRSALFENREELARSRKPEAKCYGVAIYIVYASVDMDDAPEQLLPLFQDESPWTGAERDGANNSAVALSEWILEKYPQAEVKIILDERVNLYPGRRCRGFNSIGDTPVLGRLVKTTLRDSPIQPSAIKFMYQGEEKYTGLAVNNHSGGVQLAFNSPMRRTLDEALDKHYAGYTSNAKLNSGSGGSSWGGGANQRSGYFYQMRFIEAHPDNITLKPGEVLDVSNPPLMSITKLNASSPSSSVSVKDVTLGEYTTISYAQTDEAETSQENLQPRINKSNLRSAIENRPTLFKNRDELVRSRKPGPNCYGVAVELIYATVRGKSGDYDAPWGIADSSLASVCERVLKKLPQAKVKILLNERVNLYPGEGSWEPNSIGKHPKEQSKNPTEQFSSFMLDDSPIQPVCIKLMHDGKEWYIGLAVNNHSEGIQLRSASMIRALDGSFIDGHSGFNNDAEFNMRYNDSSWTQGVGEENVIYSGYLMRMKLIEQNPDNITLKPGELLDLSKPPLVSITKLNASLLPSSMPVKGVGTGKQFSRGHGWNVPAVATLTGTVYHEDGTTPFASVSVYVRQMVHKPTGQDYRYFGPVQTDAQGKYQLEGLPTQKLEIRAFADKMRPDSKELTLDIENPVTQDFILKPAATISGKVIAPGKVDAVYFTLESDVHHVHSVVTPDPDGNYLMVLAESPEFEIDGVKRYEQAGQQSWEWIKERKLNFRSPNEYKLTARVRGYKTVEIPEVRATLGENTANINIVTFQPTGSIYGKVVDEKGNPIVGMELALGGATLGEGDTTWIGEPIAEKELMPAAINMTSYSVIPLDPKATSRADGSFIFDDVYEGYHIIVPKPDFGKPSPKELPKYIFRGKWVAVPHGQAVTGIEIVVKPNPAVRITGRFFKSDSKTPIANAEIRYSYEQVREGGTGSGSSMFYTDDEGRYLFQDHEGGTFYLTVIFNNTSVERKIEAKDGEYIKGVDFVIPDAPERNAVRYVESELSEVSPKIAVPDRNVVRGRILSWDDKQPIENLSVTLTREHKLFRGEELRYFAFAGADGYFRSFGMKDGQYTVEVERTYNEFLPSDANLLPQSVAEVTVKDGISDEVTIYLLRGGSVSGKVFSAETGELTTEARLQETQLGSRDVYGGYELRGLKPGTHTIILEADDYYLLERTIKLTIGQNVVDFDFPLKPIERQSLAGVVLLSDGKPAPNVMISLFRERMTNRQMRWTPQGNQTNSPDGRFQFDNLPPGKYKAVLHANGFPEQVHTVEIAEKNVVDLKLQLVKGGIVSGRIIVPEGSYLPEKPVVIVGTGGDAKGVSANSSEIRDSSLFSHFMGHRRYTARPSEPEKPLRLGFDGFDTLRTQPKPQATQPGATSFRDLKFKIENVLPGEYWAIVWDNSGRILFLDGKRMRAPVMSPKKIEVKEGAETQVELQLPLYGKIKGKIVDASTGAPVPDAIIVAVNSESSVFSRGAMSNAEGKYSINVVPGKYKLTARAKGYGAAEISEVRVTPGKNTKNIKIAPLQPTGSVPSPTKVGHLSPTEVEHPGVVEGSSGNAPASATLTGTVYHKDGTTPFASASVYARQMVHKLTGQDYRYFGPVQTDAQGKYQLSGLPAQKLEIRAFADKMRPEKKELALDVENPVTQDFILNPAATISGKIIAPARVDAVYLNLDSDVHHVHGIVTPARDGSYLMVFTESLEFEIDGIKQYERQGQQSWHWIKKRDGAKPLELPESIEYKLTARARGYEVVEIPEVHATLGENTANIDIAPTQPTGSVSGKLVDEKGNPIAGMGLALATVTLEANGDRGYNVGPLGPETVSQADGSFIFNDATEGYHMILPVTAKTTKIKFSHSDSKEFPKYTFEHKQVVVPRGQAVTGVKIVAKPNPVIRITGRILKSDGKTPIANAEIRYRYRQVRKDGGGGSGGHTFYTDDEGRYLFKDNRTATYYLTVIFDDASATHKIKAKEGEYIEGMDFIMPDAPDRNAVRGRILNWDDKQPIGNIGVSLTRKRNLFGNGELNYGVWTDERGYFQCLGMEDGRYSVKVEGTHNEFMPSDTSLLPQSAAKIEVKNGVGGEVTIYLLRGGSISGKVFSASTGESIAEARLKRTQLDDRNIRTNVGGYGMNVLGGKYELPGLKPGTYAITLEADGYHPNERIIDLKMGQKVVDFDFSLQPTNGQSLAGVVLLSDGAPASNVMVSLFREGAGHGIPAGSQSSPDGRYQFDNMPPGGYKIVLNASGFPEQVHRLKIYEKSITDLKLQLVKGGNVSGRIIVLEGSHLPEKPVVVVGTDGYAKGEWTSSSEIKDEPPGHYITRPSESDLTFKIEDILPGEYWATVWDNAGQILSLGGEEHKCPVMLPQKIEVKEGVEIQVELQLPRYGKIEGKIVDADTGAPVMDVIVVAVNSKSFVFSRGAMSDARGKYLIEVIPGKYTVQLGVHDEERRKTQTLMEKVVEVKDKEAKTKVDFVVDR